MMSDSDRADQMGQATRGKLRQFIARVERLESEKSELVADIRDVYAEMKTFGLDTKVMRKVIAIRKQDESERAEQEALLDLYLEATDDEVSDVYDRAGPTERKDPTASGQKKPKRGGAVMPSFNDEEEDDEEIDIDDI